MSLPGIVIDTNVLVAGLRSQRGASFRLLLLLGKNRFRVSISVPVVVEYEDVLKREDIGTLLSFEQVDDVLNYLCEVADHREIYYLWRPFLKDPKDDMILELAVESESQYIITYNERDFAGIEKFGVETLRPKEFLTLIGEDK